MGWTVIKFDNHGKKEKMLSKEFEIENFDGLDLRTFRVIKNLNQWGDYKIGDRQWDDMLADLSLIAKVGQTDSDTLKELIEIVTDCRDEPGSFLKFYGD
jgi:hypothetical protein